VRLLLRLVHRLRAILDWRRGNRVSVAWMTEQDRATWREGNRDAICWDWERFKGRFRAD
jgi:hypothetical protein